MNAVKGSFILAPAAAPVELATVSIETLHHFGCVCGCWWSISDFEQQRSHWPSPYIHCPRCGRALKFPALTAEPVDVNTVADYAHDWSGA